MPENADVPTATTQLARLDDIEQHVRALQDGVDDVAEQIQDLHEDDYSLIPELNMPHEDASDLNHALDAVRRALRGITRITASYATRLHTAPAPDATGDRSNRAHLHPVSITG